MKSDNAFSVIHPHAGYFYVAADNKFYPAVMTNAFKNDLGKIIIDEEKNISIECKKNDNLIN